MTQLELAQKAEIEKLQQENAVMKRLAKTSEFFKFYFSECKNFKTNLLAFEYVNDLYFKYFGVYRYADYGTFRTSLNYYNAKKH